MGRKKHMPEIRVVLMGREVGWLLQQGKYPLEDQIAMRDLFARAEELTQFESQLTLLLHKFNKLEALAMHVDYLNEHYEEPLRTHLLDETKEFFRIAYRDMDEMVLQVGKRLMDETEPCDARMLQDMLKASFEGGG